ncbi:MAG: hypothetical protein ANABAC_1866 [Anaerolineae bacterium]|nr:MAG: hypothetical protein ANABAC_1866 [Anaerolineae bacterium]
MNVKLKRFLCVFTVYPICIFNFSAYYHSLQIHVLDLFNEKL